MNSTLKYYNQNANQFVQGTFAVDFKQTQDRFLINLPAGAYILDFGCGSGRDTKYFLEKGFQVDAIDGSEELCKIACDYTGIKVKQMLLKSYTMWINMMESGHVHPYYIFQSLH